MIVGVGRIPSKLLEELRKHVDHPNVFIYPEFFDDKKSLIQKRYAGYIEKVYLYRDRIVFALWPDYLRLDPYNLCDLPIIWIYPVHSLSEVEEGLPYCIDWIGYASSSELRDYELRDFVEVAKRYGYKMWFLGASSRELRKALSWGFEGVDVTTLSMPKVRFADIKKPDFPKRFAEWLKQLAEL